MSETSPVPQPLDIRAEMLRATEELGRTGEAPGRSVTSDLSIDEALLLHSIGWEPVDLVSGVSLGSVPAGVWSWGQGEIGSASSAHQLAVAEASRRIGEECQTVGAEGVVGVRVSVEVHRHYVEVELTGTAVSEARGGHRGAGVFVSDLSARDFTLLTQAGWRPLGLAFGASFVYAPRRAARTALQQTRQNVELTNYTEALYSARESAMRRMQDSAMAAGAQGVVEVKVTEGPVSFASHAIGFTAWGTAVRLGSAAHQYLEPEVVLPLDDLVRQFEAKSLRGK